MGTIHLKAEPSEITSDNINNFCFDHVERRDLVKIFSDSDLLDRILDNNVSVRFQDRIANNIQLTPEQCAKIIQNSEDINTSIIHATRQIPTEVLKANAEKLPLYHIEHQENIDKEFFDMYRERMDVESFLSIRMGRGDVLDFIDMDKDINRLSSFIRYNTPYDTVLSILKRLRDDVSEDEIMNVMDRFYKREINASVLQTEYDDNRRLANHSTRDIVRYYNNNNKPHYNNWAEYAADVTESDNAVANVWFAHIISNLMISAVKEL